MVIHFGQAAATAELIVMLYDALNVPLDADAAFQLYCALQSELREVFGIGIHSRGSGPLYPPL